MPALKPIRWGSSPEGTPKRPLTSGRASTPVQIPTFWNLDDNSDPTHLTVSGGGLVATNDALSSGRNGMRATRSHSVTGKYYFQLINTTFDANVFTDNGIGMCTGIDSLTTLPSTSLWVRAGFFARTYIAGVSTLSDMGTLSNNTLDFALDLDNMMFWVRSDVVLDWNQNALADPVTNVGGFDVSGIFTGQEVFPYVCTYTAQEQVTTGNFGASAFTRPEPTGFIAWNFP